MPWIEQDNWKVFYTRSRSSGVRIGPCDYQGTRIIYAASVPFVYVQYPGTHVGPFTDELRSSTEQIEVRDIVKGFDLRARYDLYGPDYQYEHVWRFHNDGQFGTAIIIHGPGEEIGGRHTYYVPFRFDLDISGASGDSFQIRMPTNEWKDVDREGVSRPLASWAPDYDWRIIDKASGRSVRVRGRVGDDSQLWTLRYSELESWSSWGGALPAPPGSPGSVPAVYVSGQSVQETDIVLWYLAKLQSADRVSVCGPWFALDGFPAPPDTGDDHDHGDHDHDDDHEDEHEDETHPLTRTLHYLGHDVRIEPLTGEHQHGSDRHADHGEPPVAGAPMMFRVRIDDKEIIAHELGSGGFHTHELPFQRFRSVEDVAAGYINYLEFGIHRDGRT
ncbi:MAG TPA: hypothetical protein VFT47_08650 [Vicinamibacterales bacterium]|nr:hypothetical protein [Vicinamibacterales bacterium]